MSPRQGSSRPRPGLVPASAGWFVINGRDARWFDKPGQGHSLPLTGDDEYEAETFFPLLGMAIRVMKPGEPSGTYHWETGQEDFLVPGHAGWHARLRAVAAAAGDPLSRRPAAG